MSERDLIEIRSQIDSVCEASDDQYDKWHADRGVTTSRAKWKARALAAEATIVRLSEALAEAEKKGAEAERRLETVREAAFDEALKFIASRAHAALASRRRDISEGGEP